MGYQIAPNVVQNTRMKMAYYQYVQNVRKEWEPGLEVEEGPVAIDANENKLQDEDTVTVIKDLKVKGARKILQGTREKYSNRGRRS